MFDDDQVNEVEQPNPTTVCYCSMPIALYNSVVINVRR